MSSSDDERRRQAIELSKTPLQRKGPPVMLIAMAAVSVFWGLIVLSMCGMMVIIAAMLFSSGYRESGAYIVLAIRGVVQLLLGLSIVGGGVLLFARKGVGFFLVLIPCYIIVIGAVLGLLGSFCSAIGSPIEKIRMRNAILVADVFVVVLVIGVTGFLHYAHHDDKIYRWLRG